MLGPSSNVTANELGTVQAVMIGAGVRLARVGVDRVLGMGEAKVLEVRLMASAAAATINLQIIVFIKMQEARRALE